MSDKIVTKELCTAKPHKTDKHRKTIASPNRKC